MSDQLFSGGPFDVLALVQSGPHLSWLSAISYRSWVNATAIGRWGKSQFLVRYVTPTGRVLERLLHYSRISGTVPFDLLLTLPECEYTECPGKERAGSYDATPWLRGVIARRRVAHLEAERCPDCGFSHRTVSGGVEGTIGYVSRVARRGPTPRKS